MRFIDNIQMVYFTAPQPEPLDAMKLWQLHYADEGPDEFKRIPGNPGKQTVATSTKEGRQISISSQIGRIDVTVIAVPDGAGSQSYLEGAAAALVDLTNMAEQLGGVCPLVRGAFALNQILPIEDGDPKRTIEESTGVKFPANSIEPMIQYNMQEQEKEGGGFLVNQLSSWSVVNVQTVQIDPSGTNPFTVKIDQNVIHRVDVNTAPNQSLAKVDVRFVFSNLARRATQRLANPLSDANG